MSSFGMQTNIYTPIKRVRARKIDNSIIGYLYMSYTKSMVRIFTITAMLLNACVIQAREGEFLIGDNTVKINKLDRAYIYQFLENDWDKFDKYAADDSIDFSTKTTPVYWYLKMSPPFPTNWPPKKKRSITYYGYAEYALSGIHGTNMSRSAPWVKVVLNEGQPAVKTILATTIGTAVHGENSVPINNEMAQRHIQIIKDAKKHLPNFVT